MPFDPTRKHGYSSNNGIVRQDGKWFLKISGQECDEDGNVPTGESPEGQVADALVEAAAEVPETVDDSYDPTPVTDEEAEDTRAAEEMAEIEAGIKARADEAYADRLDSLKGISVAKLKNMAKDTMASLDEDGMDYEKPQMSGAGVTGALKGFIATYTG